MGILKMNPDWYIFGSQGKPGPYPTKPDTLSKRFRDLRRALDIDEKYKFYSWKHTGNLDAVLAGVNIKAIQSQNGHVNIEDTDKYLRSLGIEHNQQIRDRQPSFDGPGPTPEKNWECYKTLANLFFAFFAAKSDYLDLTYWYTVF